MNEVRCGDNRQELAKMESGSVQCCVTSPPYWGLRDYGTATWEGGDADCDHLAGPLCSDKSKLNGGKGVGNTEKLRIGGIPYKDRCGKCGAHRIDAQLGLESTPEEYVANLVAVFREVWRVLRDDGTLWLNLGDSYANSGSDGRCGKTAIVSNTLHGQQICSNKLVSGLKPKDLVDIPWMVAFALRADGWYLRQDIIWAKPNPMPESVTDRCTKSHEYIFLLTKKARYYYDHEAVKEANADTERTNYQCGSRAFGVNKDRNDNDYGERSKNAIPNGRNKRDVWTITTKPFKGAHFATFPPDLVEPCILAGSREGDVVLDPFAGSGTVGLVCHKHHRDFIGLELNPEYADMANKRIGDASAQGRIF